MDDDETHLWHHDVPRREAGSQRMTETLCNLKVIDIKYIKHQIYIKYVLVWMRCSSILIARNTFVCCPIIKQIKCMYHVARARPFEHRPTHLDAGVLLMSRQQYVHHW